MLPNVPEHLPEDSGHSSDQYLRKCGMVRLPVNPDGVEEGRQRNDEYICRKR